LGCRAKDWLQSLLSHNALLQQFMPSAGKQHGAALKAQIKRPLLIIWDGAAILRSRKVNAWLEDQDGSVAVARLSAYAPELNPVEAIWAYLKKREIANLCCNTIGEVGQFARNRLKFHAATITSYRDRNRSRTESHHINFWNGAMLLGSG
jgi:transposase